MSKLTKLPRAEQWADRICTQLGKSVESIIDVGRLLVKAKADLVHGEWERMFDDQLVPFGVRMARMYMAVANKELLSNRKHVSVLPPAIGTLAKLAAADDTKLKNALRDGVITPDMPRKAVSALLPPKKSRTKKATKMIVMTPGDAEPTDEVGFGHRYRSAGSRLYFRISEMLNDEFENLPIGEQQEVLALLEQLITELRDTLLTARQA